MLLGLLELQLIGSRVWVPRAPWGRHGSARCGRTSSHWQRRARTWSYRSEGEGYFMRTFMRPQRKYCRTSYLRPMRSVPKQGVRFRPRFFQSPWKLIAKAVPPVSLKTKSWKSTSFGCLFGFPSRSGDQGYEPNIRRRREWTRSEVRLHVINIYIYICKEKIYTHIERERASERETRKQTGFALSGSHLPTCVGTSSKPCISR